MTAHECAYFTVYTYADNFKIAFGNKKKESPFLDLFSTSTGEEEGAGRVEMSVREGLQEGSETYCEEWFRDGGTNKNIGGGT